jgi:cyanophycinase
MALSKTSGQLVIIGGAEDKDGECKILREFVRCAGGLQARIVVMTAATDRPGAVGDDYIRVFERLGVKDIQIVDTFSREDASASSALEAIKQATGVFFTGGDQARITSSLKDTETDATLHKRYQEGIVVGGTSAGAAMMPETMIVEGISETNPRVEIVEMDCGMGFLPGVVIDQHFAQRGRLGRLLSAVAQQPHLLGLGIDENTGIVVSDGKLEVVGEGAVTVIDLGTVTHNNLDKLLKDENLALCDVKLHILPEGYRFNLESRRPIVKVAASRADQMQIK